MKILTNIETTDAIKTVLEAQSDKPQNIRLFMAGSGWSGPSFGLALDEQKENDFAENVNDVNFVMDKDAHSQFGDMSIEFLNGGYMVKPADQDDSESDCGSCGGSCS